MKVLIVDDYAEMRRWLRSLVADLASEIEECSDGAAAVAACSAYHPDIVLMDIAMAPMDGLEATARIHAADPSIKLVIVTAHDETGFRAAAAAAGACGYVLKDNLIEVRRWLQSAD